MEHLPIDPEAKAKIDLIKHKDNNGDDYFTGKLQFPGTLDLEGGASFMVFTSEEGVEQLQIGPLDPRRRNNGKHTSISNGKFSIRLNALTDQKGEIYYVGEAVGFCKIQLKHGIFFTIFTSKTGFEELQVSKLKHRYNKFSKRNNKNDSYEDREFSE